MIRSFLLLLAYLFLPAGLHLLVALPLNFMIVSAFVPRKSLHLPSKWVWHQTPTAVINKEKQSPGIFFNNVCFGGVANNNNDGENIEDDVDNNNKYLQDKWRELKLEGQEGEFLVLLNRKVMELELCNKLEELDQLLRIWNFSKMNEFRNVGDSDTYLKIILKGAQAKLRIEERKKLEKEQQQLIERKYIGELYRDSILNELVPIPNSDNMSVLYNVADVNRL